jgi:hypothetical protein
MKLLYEQTMIRQKERESLIIQLRYGEKNLRLPDHPRVSLKMVVIEGFGEKPLMLLTNTNHLSTLPTLKKWGGSLKCSPLSRPNFYKVK